MRGPDEPVPGALEAPTGMLLALALLAGEFLIFSVLFDVVELEQRVGDLAWLKTIGPLAFAGLTVVPLLDPAGPGAVVRSFRALVPPLRRRWPWALGHLVLAAAFFAFSIRLIHQSPALPGDGRLWFLLWLLAGLCAVALLLPVALRVREAARLVRARPSRVALTALAALGAFAAGLLAAQAWDVLAGITLVLSGTVLGLLVPGVEVDVPLRILGTGDFSVVVAGPCSGADGVGLVVAFLSLYLAAARRDLRFPRALWLLPAGVLLAIAANTLRIVLLVLVGSSGHADLAVGAFHSKLGWVLFCAAALGLVWASRRLRWFTLACAKEEGPTWNPVAAWLLPVLAVLATGLLASLFSPHRGLDPLYPLRLAAGCAALWLVRRDLPRPRLSFSWTPLAAGLLVGAAWVLLESGVAVGQEVAAGIPALSPASRAGWLAARLAGAVLLIPLVEEMAFRGYVQRRLVAADFTAVPFSRFRWASMVGTPLLFAALHQHFGAGLLAGGLFQLVTLRRGLLGDAVLAHAVANAVIAVAVLGGGRWELWS